jgi:alpha-D-xyloside xylohydrolase
VTEQGSISRKVYLPAGTDWYNYWTNEKVHGGQTIDAAALIDTIPLFVRAGSIIPMGVQVESTHENQAIEKVRVYPGADASFTIFSDDGMTYAYEKGAGSITRLHWDDAKQQLTHEGASAWNGPDSQIVEMAGH